MFKKSAKGFTLIELLIVIAVLGILAVAVLSAINPIEQINRSRDTGSRSDAEQLISAIDRYYATNGYYPWQASAEEVDTSVGWEVVDNDTPSDGVTPILTKLSESGTGELKASFTNRISADTYNKLYIYNDGEDGSSTYVCFNTKSSSFRTEAQTRCASLPTDLQGASDHICVGGSPAVYYSCLP
jgi:prepilin-type N-terminal cleavage/methylation domain-containing protein